MALRVGVRHYRQPRGEQNTGTTWAEQAARSGGVIGQQQSQRSSRPSQGQYQQSQGRSQFHQQGQGRSKYPQQHPGHSQYTQQSQGHHQYPQQYQQQYLRPQYQQQSQQMYPQMPVMQMPQGNLNIENRFVADGFATDVWN